MQAVSDVLDQLGWSAEVAAGFAPYAGGAVPARVSRVDRSAYDVIAPDGPARAVASLPVQRAATADPMAGPTVGDWVALRPGRQADEYGVLLAVLERRTAVVRGSAGRQTVGQLLAANVDVLLIVVAAVPPAPLNRVERLLALAWDSGARPAVVLSKTDLLDDVTTPVRRLRSAAPGADVLAVSALTGDGLAEVAALVSRGVTGALVGASGSGKSTLGNALAAGAGLPTSGLRADGKGRHTTAWRELVPVPGGGVLLDTPGLRGVQLWDAPDGLDRTFADVAALAVDCRFRDCRHEGEPGCAVAAAVGAGLLDARRVASLGKLRRELAWLDARRDGRARLEERRRWKDIHKQMRQRGREGFGPRP